MTEVSIREAKIHMSRLLARVAKGEEIVITRAGKPIAKLVKVDPKPTMRFLGSGVGTIKFTPGWDAPMTDGEFEEFIGG